MKNAAITLMLVILHGELPRAAPPVTAAALAPDGKHAVLGSQSGIEVRNWPELAGTTRLETELVHIHDLAFSPDGRTLLAAGGAPAEEGVVEVLDWPSGKRVRRVAEHADLVYRVAWSPDGKQWTTAGGDGICQVFDAATGRRLTRYAGHSRAVLAVCYLPDGKAVISAGADQTLQLWDSATGHHLRTLDNHVGTVNDLAIAPLESADARPIVASVSEDRTVRLWQPTIGRLMRFARLPSIPRVIAWSPRGDRLLVGCNDGHLRIMDAETVELVSERFGLEGRVYSLTLDVKQNRVLLAGEAGPVSIPLGDE